MYTRPQKFTSSLLVKVLIAAIPEISCNAKGNRTIEDKKCSGINLFIFSCDGEGVGTQEEEVFCLQGRGGK